LCVVTRVKDGLSTQTANHHRPLSTIQRTD